MRIFFAGLFVFFLVCLIGSCREGCKDKTAINYDSRATVENGTCMYCSSSYASDSGTYFFAANNAPNPNANAIEFILVTTNASVLGNGCQSEGKQVGSVCNNYLRLVNLTNKTITGEFEVEFDQNNFETWFYDPVSLQPIGPMDTINFGFIDTGCSNITTGTMQGNFFDLQFN